MTEKVNMSKISSKFMNQCNVLCELQSNLKEFRPESLKGFFFTSNLDAFAIAEDVVSGVLTDLKMEWIAAVNATIQEVLIITSSERKTLKTLSDLGISLREILSDIESYDRYTESNPPK